MTKRVYEQKLIEPKDFNAAVQKLRTFFQNKNYSETFPQPRQSIMAACEDPKTVSSYTFAGMNFPLPQTNQMWLERDLLVNPEIEGVYCLTTSYRDEPKPIEGRHDKIFPMFEFEHIGDYKDLIDTLKEFVIFLGFKDYKEFKYDDLCEYYGVETLEAEQELKMWEEFGDVVILTHFPERTSPFWNMKKDGKNIITGENLYHKSDFIICGMETFGSAQRSSNVEEMRHNFHTISNGEYANLLYHQFTKERVEEELEDYLALNMIDRFGGGIGMTRFLRALKIKNLLY